MRSPANPRSRVTAALTRVDRAWVIGALGVGGAMFFARWLGTHQPLRSWLLLQLAAIWIWQLCLAAACASVGYRLADRMLPPDRWTAFEKLAVGSSPAFRLLVRR